MEIECLRRVQNTSTTSPNRELICKYIGRGSRGYGTTNTSCSVNILWYGLESLATSLRWPVFGCRERGDILVQLGLLGVLQDGRGRARDIVCCVCARLSTWRTRGRESRAASKVIRSEAKPRDVGVGGPRWQTYEDSSGEIGYACRVRRDRDAKLLSPNYASPNSRFLFSSQYPPICRFRNCWTDSPEKSYGLHFL